MITIKRVDIILTLFSLDLMFKVANSKNKDPNHKSLFFIKTSP